MTKFLEIVVLHFTFIFLLPKPPTLIHMFGIEVVLLGPINNIISFIFFLLVSITFKDKAFLELVQPQKKLVMDLAEPTVHPQVQHGEKHQRKVLCYHCESD